MLGFYSEASAQADVKSGAVGRMETTTDRQFRKVHHALTPERRGRQRRKIYLMQMDQIEGNCVTF